MVLFLERRVVKELEIIQATQSLLNLPIPSAFFVNPRLHFCFVSDFLHQPTRGNPLVMPAYCMLVLFI